MGDQAGALMPQYDITAPDGRKFRLTAPEGATQEQILAYAQQNWDRRARQKAEGEADMRRMADPTSGMGFLDKFNAGMGKAFTDIGRGASQLVNAGPSAEDVRETRRLDAPLMQTGAGMAGNVAGNIAALAPASVLPGASAIPAAGAIGATIGALQPTEGVEERLTNMAVGGGLGAGTQAASTVGAQKLGEALANRETRLAAESAKESVRQKTLEDAVKAGYTFPPSVMNPSFINKRLESIGGKAAVSQQAAINNQRVTDRLASAEAGIAEGVPLTESAFRHARDVMAAPYREVAATSPLAEQSLTQMREARQQANKFYKAYEKLPLPSLESKAERLMTRANLMEKIIEGEAKGAGKPELIDALRQARTSLAKNFDVERALNLGSGEIDASVLGRAYDKGAPFTGNLEMIAKTQQALRPYLREGSAIPTPGVSKSEALAAALLGTIGSAAHGPGGAIAGGLPLLSGPARSLALSPMWQKMNITAQPQGAGLVTKELAMLRDPEAAKRLGLVLRTMGPGIAAALQEAE